MTKLHFLYFGTNYLLPLHYRMFCQMGRELNKRIAGCSAAMFAVLAVANAFEPVNLAAKTNSNEAGGKVKRTSFLFYVMIWDTATLPVMDRNI